MRAPRAILASVPSRPLLRVATRLVALGLAVTGIALVLPAPEAAAVGDATRLTFNEDSIPRQLSRRIQRAPEGRLVWIRLDPQITQGPVLRTADSVLVGRHLLGGGTELLEYSSRGRIRKRATFGQSLATDPVLDPLGRIVLVDDRGSVRWLSADLKVLKQSRIRGRSNGEPPAVNDRGDLFVAHRNGYITQFSPSGSLGWRTSLKGSHPGRPVPMAKGCLVCTGTGKTLVHLGRSGKTAWEIPVGPCDSMPVPTPGGRFIVSGQNRLFSISDTGKIQWQLALVGQAGTPARAPDGTLYVVTRAGVLMAVSPSGKRRWTFPVGRSTSPGRPVIGPRGRIHLASPLGHLLVISPAGKLLWHQPIPKRSTRLVVRWDGSVVVGSHRDSLRLVAPPRTRARPATGAPARPRP